MPAERAGYTVTMFLVDTSPPMGALKTVELPPSPNGEKRTREVTHLEYALQFVKLKIQEMIFNGRKTDQCGVITFGSEETDNIVNEKNGGYDNVQEYIPIAQPNGETLTKLDALRPSTVAGDAIDGLIVGIETQASYLASKKTWTRKIVLLTNAECPIEIEDWEATVKQMDAHGVSLTIVGIDFDDEELPYSEPNKSNIKQVNEKFFHTLTSTMKHGVMGNCTFALQEISRPEVKVVRSTLMGTILRLGDVDTRAEEAIEVLVKASKATALTRPATWKKYTLREDEAGQPIVVNEDKIIYAPVKLRTEYYVNRNPEEDGDVKMDENGEEEGEEKEEHLEKVEKEELVRGFKYGSTYAPCPDGQFPRLQTQKGIDICGFFHKRKFRRELSMGEIQYIWADPSSPQQQVALSSIVQAMYEAGLLAIARWVTKDGADPKMGVLSPEMFDNVDCLLWAQMPFADDVRKYTFASLDKLVSKTGEIITKHPYIPTGEQQEAMDEFVDAMDLMAAGEKDEEGNRMPWYSTLDSYNPSVHRTKQAMFHCAVVSDLTSNPLPSPHPEILKYLEPSKKVLKRARESIERCKEVFKVKEVPKKVSTRTTKKDGHEHAAEDDDMLLLDRKREKPEREKVNGRPLSAEVSKMQIDEDVDMDFPKQMEKGKGKQRAVIESGSETEEDEEDEESSLLLEQEKPQIPVTPVATSKRDGGLPLPTPARSISPEIDPGRAPGRIIGTTYPLKDFQKNIAQGDVVTKAVADLGEVIIEIVLRPFASRRHKELIECMKVLRDTCLKEDEIDQWNAFLPDMKEKCLQKPGNPEFWKEVTALGREISLISNKEAKKYGGAASISEKRAEEFVA